MIESPALQDTTAAGQTSAAAAGLAPTILSSATDLDLAITSVAEHLMSSGRVAGVLCALTSITPDSVADWRQLGGRAWLREWVRTDLHHSLLPPPGAGPEAALTMPWLSRVLRTCGVAVVIDRDLLPPEASQDYEEVSRMGVASLISSALTNGDTFFGSLSVASLDAGRWPDELVQDFKLLNAALISRLSLEHSRRALAEAILAGSAAQDAYQQFFGAVGHELRTPISSILGYAEVLIDEADQADETDDLARSLRRDGPVIVRQCERLLGIVDSLLGAGRVLSDDEERADVVIADAVADVVHWHRSPAGTAGVEMMVDVDPVATVRAHASGVRQVLTSLVGNAIAHHHPEGGTISISTARLLGESGQEMVRIIVRDDGPGLPPEDLEKAFDPFARYAGFSTQSSGLGLPMARTLAERDGGAVRGESAPGVGSSFWLELPVREAAG